MEVLALGALAPLPGEPQGLRCQLHPREPTLGLFACFSPPQNIRMWDMQDYECLQSFCGKHFALGHCPITSAYFHKDDGSLICSTYSVSAAREGGGTVAAPRGEGPWLRSAVPWDTEGWSHPVRPETASCHEDKAARLCDLVLKAPVSWDFLGDCFEALSGHPLRCCPPGPCILETLLLEAHLKARAGLEAPPPAPTAPSSLASP